MPAGTCHDESAGLQRVLRPGSLRQGALGQSLCTALLRFVDCASLPQCASHMSPLITVQPPSPKRDKNKVQPSLLLPSLSLGHSSHSPE